MRRSNYVVGLTASVLVHAAVIVVLRTRADPSPAPAPPAVVASVDLAAVEPDEVVLDAPPAPRPAAAPEPLAEPVPVRPPPAPAPPAPGPVAPAVRTAGAPGSASPETDPAPEESPPPPPTTVERASPPPPAPSRVVEPLPSPPPEPATAAPSAVPIDAPAVTPDSARASRRRGQGGTVVVPPLRVHWRNAAEVLAVARTMGMRLAAVDRNGVVIGEVDLAGAPSLRRWSGLPVGYSSRVRMLSPSIFSARLGGEREADVHEIWLFVPADRDHAMIEAQRAAARRAGARPEDVRVMDGRFVRAADGTYRLEVTGLRPTAAEGARDE